MPPRTLSPAVATENSPGVEGFFASPFPCRYQVGVVGVARHIPMAIVLLAMLFPPLAIRFPRRDLICPDVGKVSPIASLFVLNEQRIQHEFPGVGVLPRPVLVQQLAAQTARPLPAANIGDGVANLLRAPPAYPD